MGAPTPLVLLPLWCSYPLGCSYPLVLLRWVLLPLGCSYPIGCSYPLRFVFVLVDVSLLMGGLNYKERLVVNVILGPCCMRVFHKPMFGLKVINDFKGAIQHRHTNIRNIFLNALPL